jgi:pseudouridine-5'-phosphate glycosidase
VLVCNPIPAVDALDASAIEATIALALADAERDDVRGKHLTPFLLARVAAATAGVSIRANRALAINNARVAAELAMAFAAIAAVGDQR